MPPWIENTYANAPLWTTVKIFSSSGFVQVIGPNPQRIALMLCSDTTFYWTTDPTQVALRGIVTANTLPNQVITQKDLLSACSAAWYATSVSASGFVTTMEVILRTWPTNT